MSRATNYALRLTRAAGFAWLDFVRDVRDGAFATARLVVTFPCLRWRRRSATKEHGRKSPVCYLRRCHS
jgi:hypothetical protein